MALRLRLSSFIFEMSTELRFVEHNDRKRIYHEASRKHLKYLHTQRGVEATVRRHLGVASAARDYIGDIMCADRTDHR